MMNEQLEIRKRGDRKSLAGSLDNLTRLVRKPKRQQDASTKDYQYLTRRFPNRALSLKDMILFALLLFLPFY